MLAPVRVHTSTPCVLALHSPSHERLRFCLRTCTLHPCDAGSADAKPSHPAAHTNGTGPPLQPDELAAQTGVNPLPTVAAGDTACRYNRCSVTAARWPLRRAKLWLSFLPTRALRRNQHLWTLRRMRTKARFNGFFFNRVALSFLGPFLLRPTPTSRLSLSHSHLRLCTRSRSYRGSTA